MLTLLVGLPAKVTAASGLFGVIQDEKNNPIDGATVALQGTKSNQPLETLTVSGQYRFDRLEEGDYLLVVDKPGFSLLYGAVSLKDDAPHQLDLVVVITPFGRPRKVEAAAPTVELESPKNIEKERAIRSVPPKYPDSARQTGITGSVPIRVIRMPDGTLNDLVVLSAPTTEFALSALLSMRQWRYAVREGKPVQAVLTIHYTLSR